MDKVKLAYHRIVAKFGTSLLTGGSNHLSRDIMSSLVGQVAQLHRQKAEVLIVTSGAVAAGRFKLGLTRKIRGMPFKQVLASVGQSRLMSIYEDLFQRHDITVAQALLTKHDLGDRAGYLNARNTLLALMELGVIGIVNENDVVAVDEMQEAKFGDNDNLSAMVANLIDADLLLLLTDIAGLYTADPRFHPDATLIPRVDCIGPEVENLAAGSASSFGIGGMVTKIEAARMATSCGVRVVIADGRVPDIIIRLVRGEDLGTHFPPHTSKVESRKRWMLSGLATRGTVVVDAGAAEALLRRKRSLLPSGIQEVQGDFGRGDIVDICDTAGRRLGSGISNYSREDIGIIRGKQSGEIVGLLGYDYGAEVVHRNNLVMV